MLINKSSYTCNGNNHLYNHVCVCAGGTGWQHRTGSELPTTDQQLDQPLQSAALLEHVQQVNGRLVTSEDTFSVAQKSNKLLSLLPFTAGGTWR